MPYKSKEARKINQRKYYENRKNLRLCFECHKPLNNGKTSCDTCLKDQCNKAKENYYNNKDLNKCVKCRENNNNGNVLCDSCLEVNRNRFNENYQKNKYLHKCVQCNTETTNDKTCCDRCLKLHRHTTRNRIEEKRKNNLCDKCGKSPPEKNAFQCRICLDYQRKRNYKTRNEVFEAYGGYKCVCCGENNKWFLQIDHINNDGAEHLKSIKCNPGSGFYEWLKKNNFPSGFQVLCSNCNFSKGKYGSCPHTWENSNPELPPQAIRLGRVGTRKKKDDIE